MATSADRNQAADRVLETLRRDNSLYEAVRRKMGRGFDKETTFQLLECLRLLSEIEGIFTHMKLILDEDNAMAAWRDAVTQLALPRFKEVGQRLLKLWEDTGYSYPPEVWDLLRFTDELEELSDAWVRGDTRVNTPVLNPPQGLADLLVSWLVYPDRLRDA